MNILVWTNLNHVTKRSHMTLFSLLNGEHNLKRPCAVIGADANIGHNNSVYQQTG